MLMYFIKLRKWSGHMFRDKTVFNLVTFILKHLRDSHMGLGVNIRSLKSITLEKKKS